MIVSRVVLKNWRNFQTVDIPLRRRMFFVGANASGKSNLLDVFRFLRDIAQPGGGLQSALRGRGGLSSIRCLAARRNPRVEIAVELANDSVASTEGPQSSPAWRYEIGIRQEQSGRRRQLLAYERVLKDGRTVLERPNPDDKSDEWRLTQTHLEQISANEEFRPIAEYFHGTTYLHLVPQLVRHSHEFSGPGPAGDPFGRGFMERIGRSPSRTRDARLKKMQEALTLAVPQLKNLSFVTDTLEGGVPHLEALYEHWRPNSGRQRERDFSDGTLRLLGLLWSLLESDSLLLLEEPELSLNASIVRELAPLIYRMQRKRGRQVLATTHSSELISDSGIAPEEVVLLVPGKEGTAVRLASSLKEVRNLLDAGLTMAEAILPRTESPAARQLSLFE